MDGGQTQTFIVQTDAGDGFEIRPRRRRHELFFQFMLWIAQSGLLARMSGAAAKVYLALGTFSDFRQRTCVVSSREVCERAGVARSSLFDAIGELVAMGLLEVVSGRQDAGNAANAYRLPMTPPCSKNELPLSENRTRVVQKSDKPLSDFQRHPSPKIEQQYLKTPEITAAESAAAAELRAALAVQGIDGKARDELSRTRLTPAAIAETARRMRGLGKGHGAIIKQLYADAEAANVAEGITARESKARAAVIREELTRAKDRELELLSQQREADARFAESLRKLPPAELQALVDEFSRSCPHAIGPRESRDPIGNAKLRGLMRDWMQRRVRAKCERRGRD